MLGGLGGLPLQMGNQKTPTQKMLKNQQVSHGSYISKDLDGVRGRIDIAKARAAARVFVAKERAKNDLIPSRSSQELDNWATRMGVVIEPGDTRHDIRKTISAKFIAAQGPTQQVIINSIEELLDDGFNDVIFFYGTVGDDNTFWVKNKNPGTTGIGGDSDTQWATLRNHILIVANQPSNLSLNDFVNLLEGKLTNFLQTLFPSWATFDWTIEEDDYDGFTLDVDKLDITAL